MKFHKLLKILGKIFVYGLFFNFLSILGYTVAQDLNTMRQLYLTSRPVLFLVLILFSCLYSGVFVYMVVHGVKSLNKIDEEADSGS